MGFVDDDNVMDLVTGSYPTLDSVGTAWINGPAEYYLLTNSQTSFDSAYADWSSSLNYLTTSIALGQFDSSDTTYYTLEIDFDTDSSLQYFSTAPIAEIISVKDTNGVDVDDSLWCYDLKTGWISFDQSGTYNDPLTVNYAFWDDLDLAVGNNGKNYVFYNGNTSGGSMTGPSPQTFGIDSVIYTAQDSISTSQMDTTGAIGFVLQSLTANYVMEVLEFLPEVNNACIWINWERIEWITGHYYWDNLDKILDILIDNDPNPKKVLIQEGQAETGNQWSFPCLYNEHNTSRGLRLRNPKMYSYFLRNLINRYRPGGVISTCNNFNNYGWDANQGVESFMVGNDMNGNASWGYI